MKPNKDFRPKGNGADPEDALRKAVKLAPLKKSGKERHQLYDKFDDDDVSQESYCKRESVLDYFDEEEE